MPGGKATTTSTGVAAAGAGAGAGGTRYGTSAPSSSSTTKIIPTRLQIFGRNVTPPRAPPAGRCIKEEKKGKKKKYNKISLGKKKKLIVSKDRQCCSSFPSAAVDMQDDWEGDALALLAL